MSTDDILDERRRDLSDIAGTWREDPEFDNEIVEQDTIDPDLWRD